MRHRGSEVRHACNDGMLARLRRDLITPGKLTALLV
jgi:hypothetical protein